MSCWIEINVNFGFPRTVSFIFTAVYKTGTGTLGRMWDLGIRDEGRDVKYRHAGNVNDHCKSRR